MDKSEWLTYFSRGYPALWVFVLLWIMSIGFAIISAVVSVYGAFKEKSKEVRLNWNPTLKFTTFLFLVAAII